MKCHFLATKIDPTTHPGWIFKDPLLWCGVDRDGGVAAGTGEIRSEERIMSALAAFLHDVGLYNSGAIGVQNLMTEDDLSSRRGEGHLSIPQ